MTAEPPTTLARPHAQPRPWDEDHGREVREFGPPRQEPYFYDADTEEAHWEATHDDQQWADSGDFTDFASAYRIGYEGFNQLGADNSFDDVEEELQEEYEGEGNFIRWEEAREASRAAWGRLEARMTKAEKNIDWPVP